MATKNQKPKSKIQKAKTKPVKSVVAPTEVKLAGNGRVITGRVVSNKMVKTVVVEEIRLVAHSMYHKRMKKTNKFHAHDELGVKINEMVEISECRPISKTKNFVVTRVIKSSTN